MEQPFIHLRVHSEFSIVDGLIRVPALVTQVAALGMPAAALTDQGNLFAAVKFYRAAERQGLKPIIGADLWLEDPESQSGRSRVLLLCQNQTGYQNLSELITRSYLELRVQATPAIHKDWLQTHHDGLLALSGAREGNVGIAILSGNFDRAEEQVCWWRDLFGDRFYLEVQRTSRPGETEYNEAALDLASQYQVPVVATNDVCFLRASEFEAHETRVCINQGRTLADPRRQRRYSAEQFLRSPQEMAELFSDIPQAIENSWHIAKRCTVEFGFDEYHLPEFPLPEGTDLSHWLESETREGLQRRTGGVTGRDQTEDVYESRLKRELEVISGMGFAGYFLIVADFIKWAKDNGIPVGPGRGSGAGSLVAYALGITDLDPLEFDLLFERFLNPERVSMPDFDIDFCMERRDEVIEYVAERYGRDHVAQIITFGTMAAKAVVRDVGRALGYPYGFVDQIAKLIPFELNMTLERALKQEPNLKERYATEEEVKMLMDRASELEGLARNAGKHAGGVVIAPRALTQFMPLYCEHGSTSTVTQFDMGDVESIGLVKFDFLGLRTLTIIDWTIRDVNLARAAAGEEPIDIGAIPTDDPDTYKLVQSALTTAVFQLESRGMKDLIKRLRPDSFDDLVALVALFRPGPLQSGMVEDFIERKHGRARVQYPHPALEPILKPTYGVILYQEQVMQIAQELAGFTLGAADLLRRAMGKKKAEEMAEQRAIFTDGAAARGVDKEQATRIFDLMEHFAGYGFNKSHSAAYALVAYQTAWLKTHYPAAFMAAVLSADMDNSDKVIVLLDECRQMAVEVEPPAISEGKYPFTVTSPNQILFGLGAVKGAGEGAVDAIVTEREARGRFQDLFDFCRRIDLKKANRRVVEALIKAGALDALGPSRSALMATLDDALRLAEQHLRDKEAGQNDLFGLDDDSSANNAPMGSFVDIPEWPEHVRLAGERETLGVYLTGHPIGRYESELAGLVSCRLADVKSGKRRVAGLITQIRSANTRRGRLTFAVLDDSTGRTEVRIFPELQLAQGDLLVKDRILVVEGECDIDKFTGDFAITADALWNIEQAREAHAKCLVVEVDAARASNGFIDELESAIAAQRGGPCPVQIEYWQDSALAHINLGDDWRVHPTDTLLDAMRSSFGVDRIRLEY